MPTRLPAAERREQLLDVAMTEFAANGYHGTTMNHVAKAAGITKPVLYQHFASKRELYVELVDDVADRLASQVLKSIHPTDSYFQITVNALSAYFSFVEQNEREFQLLFGRSAPRDEDTANGSRMVETRMSQTIADILKKQNARGNFKSGKLERPALLVYVSIYSKSSGIPNSFRFIPSKPLPSIPTGIAHCIS